MDNQNYKTYASANEIYMGQSYSDLCVSWFNWLVSLNPDNHNNGPVFYLRGMDFAQDRNHYASQYAFARLGSNKLKISEGKAIFWPIIFYYLSQYHYPNLDERGMYRLLTKWMDNGDNPPANYQATIDGEPIEQDFSGKRVISPVFDLTIPDGAYGKTLAPKFTDEPFLVPGTWRCVAGGYFVLLKGLEARSEPYTIVSHGVGEMGYITDTVVQIQVQRTGPTGLTGLKGLKLAGQNEVVINQANDLKNIVVSSFADEADRDKISDLVEMSHGQKQPRKIVIN
jgi:hypothetical protein